MLQFASVSTVTDDELRQLLTTTTDDPSTEVGAVYVFTGADATVQDVQGNDGDPLVSALVALQQDSNYGYEVGFLETGDYTVAYTCQAVSDDPETADEITFVGTSNVSITAGNQTTLDF